MRETSLDACAEIWRRTTALRGWYQPDGERPNPVRLQWMRELQLVPWPEISLPPAQRPEWA